jgi:hypothetical protein
VLCALLNRWRVLRRVKQGLSAVRPPRRGWQVHERRNVVFWVIVGAVLKTIKEDYLAVDKTRYRSTGRGSSGLAVHRSDEVCSLL